MHPSMPATQLADSEFIMRCIRWKHAEPLETQVLSVQRRHVRLDSKRIGIPVA